MERPTRLPGFDSRVPPPGYPASPLEQMETPKITYRNHQNQQPFRCHPPDDPSHMLAFSGAPNRHSYHGGATGDIGRMGEVMGMGEVDGEVLGGEAEADHLPPLFPSPLPPLFPVSALHNHGNHNNHMNRRMTSFSSTSAAQSIDIRYRNALRAKNSLESRDGRCLTARKRHSIANLATAGLSCLPEFAERMKSSSTTRGDQPIIDHTMQQGADINSESPRAGSIASLASINSAASNEKHPAQQNTALSHGQSTVIGAGGMPLEGRVLVDPSTGQHYIVPTQPAPGMYYPQPIPYGSQYYQPSPNPYGYFSPHLGPGYGGGQPYPMPYAQSARYAPHATPPQFRHPPFSPMTSRGSCEDVRRGDQATSDPPRYGDQPPPSPSLMSKQNPPPVPFAYPPQYGIASHRVSPPQPADPDPGDPFRRDSTRLSNEFSHHAAGPEYAGFQRTGSQGSGTSLEKFQANSQQNWWSPRATQPLHEAHTDVEGSPKRTTGQMGAVSDNEGARRAQQQQQQQDHQRVAPKAVRMDFDFTKPMPEEEELARREKEAKDKQAQAQEKTATAFTVTFDAEPRQESLSLQDAARKSGTGRRLLNRRQQMNEVEKGRSGTSMGVTQSARPADDSTKHYLLNKLLQGPLSSSGPSPLSPEDTPQMNPRKDNDAVSEAGTFVIGAGESKAAGMMRTRIVGDSSDTDSDQSSSSDNEEPIPQRSASPRRTAAGVEGRDAPGDSTQLLKELIALKRAQARPSTSMGVTSATASGETTPMGRAPALPTLPTPTSSATSPVSPTHRGRPNVVHASTSSSSAANRSLASARAHQLTSSNNPNFRRGDGGRFSMRTQQASPQTAKRPPFRTGNPSNRPPPPNPHVVAQREQEMNAWLRRKDYNPMRAVQEAKRAQQQKQSNSSLSEGCSSVDSQEGADNFISNRSISFHVGAGKHPVKRTSSPGQSLSRNKSDESLAYEGASTASASQRVIAEYSRGVVKDISRLTERSRKGEAKELSGLARAVDLLSNKCKKSIELIRSQNKGCLSVSVEDLLATAVEPPGESESLAEQLERLSDAFDAVQRYLEQYSLDGRASPVLEDEEQPETSSLVSGFSSLGLRGKPKANANVSTGSLVAGTREIGQSSRAHRTTAYRSKILAQQRDSSATRLGKNN